MPRDLETICLKCLEKEPARRYFSAAALADDLERWLRQEPIEAHAATTWTWLGKWVRRKPVHAALAATVGLAIVVAAVGLFWHHERITAANLAIEAANRKLADQVRRLEWQKAEESINAGQTPGAMATFARFVRETPGDVPAASRLFSLLESRAFPLPVLPPLNLDRPITRARFDHTERKALLLTDDGVLHAWNLASGALEKEARLNLADDIFEVLPKTKCLLAQNRAGRVMLWDYEAWQVKHELGDASFEPGSAGWSEDDSLVALVSPKHELQLWETTSGKLAAQVAIPGDANLFLGRTLGPDGESLLKEAERNFWLWRPQKHSLERFWEPRPLMGCFALDWVNHRAIICAAEPANHLQVFLVDLLSGREIRRQPFHAAWHLMRLSADRKRVFVSGWGGGSVILDAETLNELSPVFGHAAVHANLSADAAFNVGFRALHDGSGLLFNLHNAQSLQEPVQHRGLILGHDLTR